MSRDETGLAESLLLDWLKSAGEPLDHSDIQRIRARENASVSTDALTYAVWDLVDKGKAVFTDDRKIIAR